MKLLTKLLLSPFKRQKSSYLIFLSKREQFRQAQLIIRIFYVIVFLLELDKFSNWSSFLTQTKLDPLWPVYWLNYVNIESGILLILYLGLISSLLAITFPNWRMTRILVFLSLLEFLAFKNSFGQINHGQHLYILLSFILIFLPSGWHSLTKVNRYIQTATLMVFSGCQAWIMLTYTMAGTGKIVGAMQQIFQGQIHSFAPKALALHIAHALLQRNEQTVLGNWLIEHYYIGWMLMLGTIYLQFFALWTVFRPSLHQLWALGLILFHIATNFTMSINFTAHCIWLALFFLNSPFRPINYHWKQIFHDLPIFGNLFHIDYYFIKP